MMMRDVVQLPIEEQGELTAEMSEGDKGAL